LNSKLHPTLFQTMAFEALAFEALTFEALAFEGLDIALRSVRSGRAGDLPVVPICRNPTPLISPQISIIFRASRPR